ncbi:uncharacterized protein LOC113557689 [Rhopalosiphum maidis]|uniref:uncharacterized protein LOC113557689 n=1 Tax=Rhopalosiphum maidis TaxID=43146 RepID=UPI000EFFB2B1|nr:uncharacterized protein LOC113557689 [Rhopalosiphum maidis]
MSNTKDPCLEGETIEDTQRPADDIDWSQFHDMFLNIEQRLPNFDHMLMAMNNYAYQRFSSLRQSNDLTEFCGVIKKGVFDWYASNINNEIRVPDFVDLTNQVFDNDILMRVDKKLVTNTISKGTNTDINKDISNITNSSANTDTCNSTNTSTNICSHASASTCSYKRARTSLNTYSVMTPNNKHSKSELEALPQLTKTNGDTDQHFKIIMPNITVDNIFTRKRLTINHDLYLGNDYERHWWKQTNNKIILNVDISDLVDCIPNIKVVVTITGFKIKIKRSDKWTVLVSNKFVKAINKCKWVINKLMHVKLTINKRENEYWSNCLVTETKELDTLNFKNQSSNVCNSSKIESQKLKMSSTKKECLASLTKFLRNEYGMDNFDTFIKGIVQPTVTNPAQTVDKLQDPTITLKLSVNPNTDKSLNSDSEGPPNTELSSMDTEVPLTLAESSNSEVTQIQSEPSIDLESVKSFSHH